MVKRLWTSEELAYLREHYGHKPNTEIAQDLDRTVNAVRGAAKTHRLVSTKDYSDAHKIIEREAVKGLPCKEIASIVLGEIGVTIRDRYAYEYLCRAGLREKWVSMDERRAAKSHNYYNKWQDWEDDFVEQCIGVMPISEIAEKLDRSENAVRCRTYFVGD